MDDIRDKLNGTKPMDREQQRFKDALYATMKNEDGMLVLMEVLKRCNLYQDVYTPNGMDMAHMVGTQKPGRWLREQMMLTAPKRWMEAEIAQLEKESKHGR